MLRIAIVDDELFYIKLIKSITEDFFEEKHKQISINTFTSGEALLSDSICYDLIFLDVQMNGINGIETAQRLRVKNKKVSLIYITSYQDYIKKSMTIHPFAFILKPVSEKEVRKNLDDYLTYTDCVNEKKSNELYYLHTTDDRHFQIDMDSILYFHYLDNRIVEVVLHDVKYKTKDSITNIYSLLNHEYFIIPNQSFIVNIHHIAEIDGKNKKLVMNNSDLILIPRRKYNETIEMLNRYITDEEDD